MAEKQRIDICDQRLLSAQRLALRLAVQQLSSHRAQDDLFRTTTRAQRALTVPAEGGLPKCPTMQKNRSLLRLDYPLGFFVNITTLAEDWFPASKVTDGYLRSAYGPITPLRMESRYAPACPA